MPSGAFLSFSAFLYREVYGICLWKIDFRIPLQQARSALDKEFFECDEYIKPAETQFFSAEKYRVSETAKSAEETYAAPETSVFESKPAKTDDSGMSLSDAEEFAQSATVTPSAAVPTPDPVSLSASATVRVGASGVLAGITAVCVAVTIGIVPVEGLTQNYVDEPPIYQIEEPIEEPIYVGTLDFLNYKIDYYHSEDSIGVFSDITFYFEGELSDGFTCELSDALTGTSVALENNVATFKNVEKGDREFYLNIYSGEEIVETRTINVEDNYINDGSLEVNYAYKMTYNSDNTGNLYAYFTTAYDGDFVTFINLYDGEGVAIDGYETVTDGAVSSVLNINEEKYSVEFVSYYVKDNNYYSYYSSEEIVMGNTSLNWNASATDDTLTLSFGNEMHGDIEVRVTHDDSSFDEFSFSSEELVDNTCQLTLSKISHNLTVEIYASAVLDNFDPSEYITDTVGVDYREIYDVKNVAAFVSSVVNLARCEIFNTSYNVDYGDTIHAPVYLYFDGFLNEGDTYSVRVISTDGSEVASRTGLTLSDKPVVFTDLSVDAEYTFMIYLTAGEEEIPAGEITKTLSVPEYSDLPSWFCLSSNPGDVFITYNEDGTSNVFIYMNVQETTYDMYYKVYLVDTTYEDESVFYECTGKDNVAIFNNVPAGRYSLKYGVMINDNGTCYSAYDMQWPSGILVTGLDENGYYPESCGSINYDSATGALNVNVSGKVGGDLRITITPDGGQPIEITVPAEDITAGYGFSECTLDLSAYGLTSFTVAVEGEAVLQYGNGDIIKNEVTVSGDENCPFKIESEFLPVSD